MKKELSEADRKKILKKHHHQKIDYALAKAFVNDSDVYKLVKDFFAEYLGLEYEFTHEELNKELNKKFINEELKKEISQFLGKLSHVQFNADTKPSQDELRSMISEFKSIVERLIVFEEQKDDNIFSKMTQFFSRLFMKKEKKLEQSTQALKKDDDRLDKMVHDLEGDTVKVEELKNNPIIDKEPVTQQNSQEQPSQVTPETPEITPESVTSQSNSKQNNASHDSASTLVREIETQISLGDMPNAKRYYKQLLSVYNGLPEDEKHQYYPKLSEYYNLLQR